MKGASERRVAGRPRHTGPPASGRRKKRMSGPRVVVDMAADLFHAGHVSFLRKVRARFPLAEITVWLHTDEQIHSYKRARPVMNFACRKAVLDSCALIERVVQAPDQFTGEALAPFDYLCHGDDLLSWDDELRERFYGAAMRAQKLVTVPYTRGISTTELIERCRERARDGRS
jgi:cytidyltransferase-like protein